MKPSQYLDAKLCLTAAGLLYHQEKVLLVKHKKLGIWLAPGGHLEADEQPHQAAEREFWEETGLRVKATAFKSSFQANELNQYLPNPFLTNLHWMNKESYTRRKAEKKPLPGVKPCEQHVCFLYLVEAISGLDYRRNIEETDGIGWFSQAEVALLETTPDIKYEVKYGFSLV